MFEKIKSYQKRISWNGLRDLRTVGLLIFLVLVLLVTWSGVKSIQTNYGLQKQVTTLKQQNKIAGLEDNNLQLQNQYYNTSQYLELSARQELGLGLPGETELLIPQNVALAELAPQATPASTAVKPKSQPWYEKNLEAWVDFFLHRTNPADL